MNHLNNSYITISLLANSFGSFNDHLSSIYPFNSFPSFFVHFFVIKDLTSIYKLTLVGSLRCKRHKDEGKKGDVEWSNNQAV